jgi:hypothetical protein
VTHCVRVKLAEPAVPDWAEGGRTIVVVGSGATKGMGNGGCIVDAGAATRKHRARKRIGITVADVVPWRDLSCEYELS